MGEDTPESPAVAGDEAKAVSDVIRIDEERVRGHLDRIVRSSVEETLNGLLDAEADRLVGGTVMNAATIAGIIAIDIFTIRFDHTEFSFASIQI